MLDDKLLIENIKKNNLLNAFKIACKSLNYTLAKFILLLRYDYMINSDKTTNDVIYEIKKNNIETIHRMLYVKKTKLNFENFFLFTCIKNDKTTLKSILCDKTFENFDYDFAFCCACLTNDVETIQLLLTNFANININAYCGAPFAIACANGNINIASYLCQNYDINYNLFNNENFINACVNNHINIVSWYCSFPIYIDTIFAGIKQTCISGSTDIFKFLYAKVFNLTYLFNELWILTACKHNNFNIVKHILRYKPELRLNTLQIILYNLCRYSKLNILKLLLTHYTTIDISANNELAFKFACLNGHLKMAKYLLKKKPDIRIDIDGDTIYTSICVQNKINIVKLFQKLNFNKYYAKIVDGKIMDYKIIRNKIVDNKINCLICYDNVSDIITSCNHQYCKACIFTWTEEHMTCPYCRSYIFNYFNII